MYIVDHYNFGTSHNFWTLDMAKAFAVKANFDASIWFKPESNSTHMVRVASYTSIGGWRDRT